MEERHPLVKDAERPESQALDMVLGPGTKIPVKAIIPCQTDYQIQINSQKVLSN